MIDSERSETFEMDLIEEHCQTIVKLECNCKQACMYLMFILEKFYFKGNFKIIFTFIEDFENKYQVILRASYTLHELLLSSACFH